MNVDVICVQEVDMSRRGNILSIIILSVIVLLLILLYRWAYSKLYPVNYGTVCKNIVSAIDAYPR